MGTSLQEYANALRHHDWWHMMSDDGSVVRRGKAAEAKLVGERQLSRNHDRLWTLAVESNRYAMEESHWRFAGAYLWVFGVKLAPEELKTKCMRDNGMPDWTKILALL